MTLETKIAEAMATKRAELIAQPLARIWPELAKVAFLLIDERFEAIALKFEKEANEFEHSGMRTGGIDELFGSDCYRNAAKTIRDLKQENHGGADAR